MSAHSQPSNTFSSPQAAGGLGYGVRVFSALDDRAGLIAVRQAAFERLGWLSPDAKADDDAWDGAPQTLHVGAYQHDAVQGAMRVTLKGWTDPIGVLPCAAHYAAIRSAGLRKLSILEMSHLVTDPRLSEQVGAKVHAALLRTALLAAQAARMAMFVTAAAPARAAFYAQLLRFHTIGTPAPYPPGTEPFTLTGGSMVGAAGRSIARHSFFVTAEDEIDWMRCQITGCLGSAPNMRQLPIKAEASRAHSGGGGSM